MKVTYDSHTVTKKNDDGIEVTDHKASIKPNLKAAWTNIKDAFDPTNHFRNPTVIDFFDISLKLYGLGKPLAEIFDLLLLPGLLVKDLSDATRHYILSKFKKNNDDGRKLNTVNTLHTESDATVRQTLAEIDFNIIKRLDSELLAAALDQHHNYFYYGNGKELTLGAGQAFYENSTLSAYWVNETGGKDTDRIPFIYNGSKKVWFHPATGEKLPIDLWNSQFSSSGGGAGN